MNSTAVAMLKAMWKMAVAFARSGCQLGSHSLIGRRNGATSKMPASRLIRLPSGSW